MKRIFFFAALALLLVSCNKDENVTPFGGNTVTVNLKFNGIRFYQQEMKSASKDGVTADSAGVSYIALAAFNATTGTKVLDTIHCTQDTNPDNFSIKIKAGTYIFVAVGLRYAPHESFEIQSPILVTAQSQAVIYEMFTQVDTITLGANPVENLSMTLNRAVAGFRIISTTPAPATADRLVVTVGDTTGTKYTSWSLNPNTLLSNLTGGYLERSWHYSTETRQNPDQRFALLLGANPDTLDVGIKVLDVNSEVIYDHYFNDVPFRINRYTVAEGPLFDVGGNFTFSFNNQWDDDYHIDW